MTFNQLEYMLKVVEHGSFSKAAMELYLAQPSLSQSIRSLEAELGVKLFYRSGRTVTLTNEGAQFVQTAKAILAEKDHYIRKICDMSTQVCGDLSIGIPTTRGNIMLPSLLPEFMRVYPNVNIFIEEAPAIRLEDMVVRGQIDMCIMNEPIFSNQIDRIPIVDEHIFLITSKQSNFDEYAEYINDHDIYPTVSIKQIDNEPFISIKPSQKLYSVATDIFRSNDVKPKVVLEIRDSNTIIKLVAAGVGSAIMVDSAVLALDSENTTKRYHIKEWPYRWSVVVGYHKARPLSNCAKAFIGVAKQTFSKKLETLDLT